MRQKLLHRLTTLSRRGFGIHSPFIFDFQRNVLHPKKRNAQLYLPFHKEPNKVLKLLLRMHVYFHLGTPLVLTKQYQIGFDKYRIAYQTSQNLVQKYDWVVMNAIQPLSKNVLQKEAFVILTGTYKDIQEHSLKKQCTVFLDLYHIGICIFKKGLSQQEFKLRL